MSKETKLTDAAMDARLAQWRKEEFKVNIGPNRYSREKEILLSVTHNGHQWNTIALNDDEIAAVIAALQEYHKRKTTTP